MRKLVLGFYGIFIVTILLFIPIISHAESNLLFEDFGGPAPPGWSILDGQNDGNTWFYWTSHPTVNDSSFNSSCIRAGVISSVVANDEQLITKSIDASPYTGSIYLEFSNFFRRHTLGFSHAVADVDISTDGGTSWSNLISFTNIDIPAEVRTIDITSFASGQPDVKIRFRFSKVADGGYPTTLYENWWIDNVRIYTASDGATVDLLSEGFNTLPDSWTVLSANGPDHTWQSISASAYNIGSPFTDLSAVADSNAQGSQVMDEQLITPSFDASDCLGSIYLKFANCFTQYAYNMQEKGDVDISIDGGNTWTNIFQMVEGTNYGPELRTLDITSMAQGEADVKVRFHYYNAQNEFWWLVDDVRVRSTQSRPTADAGTDRTVHQGDTVTLDGSGSYDPDNETITYLWSIESAPYGSAAVLDDPTSVQPFFDVDADGDYVISLVVTDINGNSSETDTVTISTENSPPVANAGADQTVHAGVTVSLDGTGSYDPDSDEFSYTWSIIDKPAESQADLDDPTNSNPTFVADKIGTYRITLVVTDTNGSPSEPDEVLISTENSAPIAHAGIDQTADVGGVVTMDGSLSSDPDNDPITYDWSFVSVPMGSSASLLDLTAVKPTFLADTPGDYVIRLLVTDIHGAVSSPDEVQVSTINSGPTADAGDDQTIHVGVLASLSGSGSDPNGDSISFSWQFTSRPSGSAAVLVDSSTATPSFTPDVAGDYTLALIVTDMWGLASDPDTVTVSTTNTRPLAEAGGDIPVTQIGTTVYLNGSQSYDPDGDDISFEWTMTSRPADSTASLTDDTTETPSFMPDVYGDYVIELIVSDPWSDSDPDSVIVSFANVKPVSDAGSSQSVTVGDTVQLNGGGSSDANGDPISFLWTLTAPAGSNASLDDSTLVAPSFTADVAGIYTASLVVNDGYENSEPSAATIEATESTGDLVTTIQDAIAAINAIDSSCFKNKNMKKTLANKLNAVLSKIDVGFYLEAYTKLQHDVLGKMDGCGGAPDKNDWIRCCPEQQQIRYQIEDALAILNSMI